MVEEAFSGTQNRRYFGRLKAILGGLRRFQTHSRSQRRRVVDGVQGIPFLMFHDRANRKLSWPVHASQEKQRPCIVFRGKRIALTVCFFRFRCVYTCVYIA